jgi:hypothetical protein
MSAVFSATITRLLGQRVNLERDLDRRAAAGSHTRGENRYKRPSRMAASLGSMLGLCAARRPWPAAADDSRGSP